MLITTASYVKFVLLVIICLKHLPAFHFKNIRFQIKTIRLKTLHIRLESDIIITPAWVVSGKAGSGSARQWQNAQINTFPNLNFSDIIVKSPG